MGKFVFKKTIRRSTILFLFFVLFSPMPQDLSAIPFSMISAGDPVLDDLRLLVRESGSSFRSFTPPLSRDEILQILDEIDPESLAPPLRELYDGIYGALSPALLYAGGLFGLEAHVNLAPEIHVRTNTNIPFSKPDTESPLALTLPLTAYFADTAELAIVPSISADPLYYAEQGFPWGVNIPYEARRFDMNMPLRAFIAAGGSWWNFQLGRDKVSYGLAHTGNLALSATPDYYDFARLSLFSRNFKYSAFVSQMPLNLEDPQILSDKHKRAAGAGALLNTTQRYLYHHRIDARFFRRVSLGISEALMAGNSSPELRYMSPLIVMHNAWPWRDYEEWGTGEKGYMTGSLFSFDLDWAIIPSLALYGQFVLNEFSTPYELENYPEDQPPNGLGYLAGIEYTHVFSAWKALAYGEFVYTDPYLYTLSSPFASYVWMRRLSEVGAKPLRYKWIGHGEGRDMMLFALGASVSKTDLLLSADISLVNRGEHTIEWDWTQTGAALKERAPTGIAERRLTLGLGAVWRPLARLSLSGYAAGVLLLNAGHRAGLNEAGLELYLSATLSY
ncbi:MAG: capsule assembly Wzi family protein [Treponema sp.]|nr:capsule assembly Wzi family protein [Treponema sp.]